MKYECTLESENNTCQFLAPDKIHCTGASTKCGFRKNLEEIQIPNQPYIRKERWYEKYYRK